MGTPSSRSSPYDDDVAERPRLPGLPAVSTRATAARRSGGLDTALGRHAAPTSPARAEAVLRLHEGRRTVARPNPAFPAGPRETESRVSGASGATRAGRPVVGRRPAALTAQSAEEDRSRPAATDQGVRPAGA